MRRPPFLREATWAALSDAERSGVTALLAELDMSAQQLKTAMEQVEQYRSLSRKLAEQAKQLLEQVRRTESASTPPSVLGRMERLAEDMESTAVGAARRDAAHDESGFLVYTAPEEPDDVEEATDVGSLRPLKR